MYHLVKIYRYRKQLRTMTRHKGYSLSISHSRSPDRLPPSKGYLHLQNFQRYLSDFHKLQCYYSITLQVATLIALYGPLSTTHSIRNPFDEAFLLLLSINGILPITLMLSTLALFGKITLYHVLLTILSAILASDTGITVVKLLSEPYGSAKRTRGSYIDWPAATGGLAPEDICGRRYEINYPMKLKPEKVFLVGAVLCDALLVGIIARWLLTADTGLSLPRCLKKRPSLQNQSLCSGKLAQWAARAVPIAAAFIFLFYAGMEYFFFYQMLVPQYDRIVNFQDWGFGQIVGIAVWAVVFIDLARHEIGMLGDWPLLLLMEKPRLTYPLALLWKIGRGSRSLEPLPRLV